MGGGIASLALNVFFYLNRVAWHAAPWSLALIALIWTTRGAWMSRWRALPDQERRGLLFALMYGVLLVVLLSPSSRVAERYIFSGTYAVAAAGTICRAPYLAARRGVVSRTRPACSGGAGARVARAHDCAAGDWTVDAENKLTQTAWGLSPVA